MKLKSMIKKIIIPTALSAMVAVTVCAEDLPSASWVQDGNSVSYTSTETFKTVLISKKTNNALTTGDVVYIGQNSLGYSTTMQSFYIKNDPDDGAYVLKEGGGASGSKTTEFTISTLYTFTGSVGDNIESVTLVDKTDSTKTFAGSVDNGTVTFVAPQGEYNINVQCASGYRKTAASTSEITITKASHEPTISITAEINPETVYRVTGTVTAGIDKVEIKQGDTVKSTISSFPDNAFSVDLPYGTYTVVTTPNKEYTLNAGITTSINVAISSNPQALINVAATRKTYTIKVTKGDNLESVTLFDSNSQPVTPASTSGNVTTYTVVNGTYTVSATPNKHYAFVALSPITVDADHSAEVNVTAEARKATTYEVKGSAKGEKHVASVKIVGTVEGDPFDQTYTLTNDEFSCQLENGAYTISAVAEDGYEISTITIGGTATTSFTVNNGNVTGIEITTVRGTPVTSTTVTPGTDKFTINTALTHVIGERVVIAVAVDENGRFIDTQWDTTTNKAISFEFAKNSAIKEFKIYVWDNLNNMNLITGGESKTIN